MNILNKCAAIFLILILPGQSTAENAPPAESQAYFFLDSRYLPRQAGPVAPPAASYLLHQFQQLYLATQLTGTSSAQFDAKGIALRLWRFGAGWYNGIRSGSNSETIDWTRTHLAAAATNSFFVGLDFDFYRVHPADYYQVTGQCKRVGINALVLPTPQLVLSATIFCGPDTQSWGGEAGAEYRYRRALFALSANYNQFLDPKLNLQGGAAVYPLPFLRMQLVGANTHSCVGIALQNQWSWILCSMRLPYTTNTPELHVSGGLTW
jgi:hypothetical protein